MQGPCAGATSYQSQSAMDILSDVENWIKWADETRASIEGFLSIVRENGYINEIDYNFNSILLESHHFAKTANTDLTLVCNSIASNKITMRDSNLLMGIGKTAGELYNSFGIVYHSNPQWHDYSNENFKMVERIYGQARDFCGDLMDATNAALRLKDYAMDNSSINVNINGGNNSQIQIGTVGSSIAVKNGASDDLLLEVLNNIQKFTLDESFNSEFDGNAEDFKHIISEAISEANKNESSDKLKGLLVKLKELASSVSSGVIAKIILDFLSPYI